MGFNAHRSDPALVGIYPDQQRWGRKQLKLLDQTALLLAKPRIVHSLPGRLRLKVPLLKRLGEQHTGAIEFLNLMLNRIEGIREVSANHLSATILVHYEPERISDDDILTFFASLSKVLISQKEDLAHLLKQDNEVIVRCLGEWLHRSLTRRLRLDTNQRIVTDDFR
jgi:hypothetical protein